uniref:Uncharacterized protein n=1 Tax=Denticeps clupeoides TaxID=299321 RepID=A0AAY4EE93_9TELE
MVIRNLIPQKTAPLYANLHPPALQAEVVPRRTMSSSVPGGSGENIVYALLCGGAYSTVKTDHARYTHRITEIQARPKAQWEPKPWPPKGKFCSDMT